MARLRRKGLLLHSEVESLAIGGAVGFVPPASQWAALAEALSRVVPPCDSKGGGMVRLAAQIPREGLSRWTEPLRLLRTRPSCCQVTLSARVREPLAHYLSAYFYATGGKNNVGHYHLHQRSSGNATHRYAVQPQPRFEDWAPPNLQSALLLHGEEALFDLFTDETTGATRAPTAQNRV